jgi:nucleoside-diphosphate-sugar epimerase
MRVVIAGGHGKIARQIGRLLAERGDHPVGLIRDPHQRADLLVDGLDPVVLDLESTSPAAVAEVLAGADAAVFAAGAGPGSGAARKTTMDRDGAILLAEACEAAGVQRLLQVSAMGVERVRSGARPEGVDEVFLAYLQAKLAAEDDLRRRDLGWTILRPGGLTDAPGTGTVRLAPSVPRGDVPRPDVAAVLLEMLGHPGTEGLVLELTSGPTRIVEAVEEAATH